ncbi:MAG: hypothetical protein KBB11_06150 [Bacteroidales bacterium]|jgi:hypothetical protein|nr:hypothetical protein [Bacteroidales bacterium]HOY38139.1 hypothetical protein [Bacteroidales bacterium]HQP03037.1 hypothetical protein [Bacteroidales bacterium]
MPQHRLPGSDFLRFKALKCIAEAVRNDINPDRFISVDKIGKNQQYYNLMEKVLEYNTINQKLRIEHQTEYNNLFSKAKMYVLHYLQIIDMAIERGEQPISVRNYYQLDESGGKLPQINNESELVKEATNLFTGDAKRTSEGGKYFTNPTIGLVKMWFDKFMEASQKEKNLSFVKTGEVENIALLRKEINCFIDEVWSEVEKNSAARGREEQLKICHSFGIEYEMTQEDVLIGKQEDVFKEPGLFSSMQGDCEDRLMKEACHESKSESLNLQFAFEFPK